MPGSQTTPGPTGARNNAPADFAFRQVNNVGTRVANDFAAQWLAYTLPYRRFADALADACAQIGGDVDCYSFIAVDCVSAWNKDPVFGVIGIQSGPRH